ILAKIFSAIRPRVFPRKNAGSNMQRGHSVSVFRMSIAGTPLMLATTFTTVATVKNATAKHSGMRHNRNVFPEDVEGSIEV
ncbi:MAG TPA: hypothetical protein VLE43_05565, partial [Candidatus Saccharimonadia bacterium]|nr:hypothetical protein [Candidatus Saccharimonadia bacterium]